ncbi:solute carrier family 35 member G1 [Tetranychus urticae]|uniref:EamA domain-containing protein n=1 Tax=Tetranychus urticae TaxID=32264 RepID=T1KJP7_TETUR|nr:solute carrier family 35 member G1 [Tetranychus urticae]
MRLKWDKNNKGTILDDPFISKVSLGDSKMAILSSNPSDDEDVLFDESETSRLHKNDRYDDEKGSTLPTSPKLNIYKGIVFSALSSIFFSMSSAIVKYLKNIHPGELALFRFIGIFILSVPLVFYHEENFLGPSDLRLFLVFRGIAGSTSLFLRFCAFRDLPFVDASVIIFTVPVVVTIFACVCLNEPCGLFQTFIVTLTMIGLCLTVRLPILVEEEGAVFNHILNKMPNSSYVPDINHQVSNQTIFNSHGQQPGFNFSEASYLRGVLAGLSSTFFAASVYIILRRVKATHYSVIMFNFGMVAIFETALITTILDGFSIPSSSEEWILIIFLMLFSFLGQILLTKSLQMEQAGPVAIVRSATDIVLAFVWQIWFFNQTPDFWSVSGAFLVVLCIFLTSLRKWILSLPEHSMIKHRLKFVR